MINHNISVTELNEYIKGIFDKDIKLNSVSVRGEISNFKLHSSGHMYFTLKDNNCKIKCVMFKSYALFMKFIPQDGMNVVIDGSVSVYQRDGAYQLYCTTMHPDGVGSLYLAYEQLKERLESEGLFDKKYKKQLPTFPNRVGVATSPTGAVIRDIINVSSTRFKGCDILLYPVKVQGDGAAETICKAIDYFNSRDDVDVIVIGRGGGSIEELWAFNEEILARCIYNSEIPIVSAVGHETDFTISDFVADVRASTPTHAAELIYPSYDEVTFRIDSLKKDIDSTFKKMLVQRNNEVESCLRRVESLSPANKIAQNSQYVDKIESDIVNSMKSQIMNLKHSSKLVCERINNLSPLNILKRGFCYTQVNNTIVKSISNLTLMDNIDVHFYNGYARCVVNNIVEEKDAKKKSDKI